MSNHPTSFAEWQSYPSTIDPIHVSWLKNAKKLRIPTIIKGSNKAKSISSLLLLINFLNKN